MTMTQLAGPQPAGGVELRSARGRAVVAAAVLGSALAYMSDDMLNVALPTLARDLGADVTGLQWVVNGYFLTMLALVLPAGSIGDVRGHRRSFLGGMATFAVGAVAAAAAPTIAVLVAGRAVQGIGAAFLLASGLALVGGSFQEEQRGRAIGMYMGLTAVATAAGPALGGLVVDVASWRAVFVVPLVMPLAAVVVTLRVPETPIVEGRRVDGPGAVLAFVTFATFSIAMIRGPADWSRPDTVLALGVAVASAVAFVRWERRSEDPMLALELFRNRVFAGGNVATLLAYLVSAGVFLFLVLQLQTTVGYGPVAAGAALVPLYVVMLVGSPLAGRVADRFGARLPVVGGLLGVAAGARWLGGVGSGSSYGLDIAPPLLVFAAGLALAGAPLTAATLGAVGAGDQGIASGVNNLVGQLAGMLMIVVLPAVAGLSGAALDGPEFDSGYRTVMDVCALLAVAAAVLATATLSGDDRRPTSQGRSASP